MSFCPSCPRSAVRPEGRAALTNRLSLVSVSFVSVSAVSHYYYYYYDYYCSYDYDYDDYLLLAFLSVSQPVSRERQRLRYGIRYMLYVPNTLGRFGSHCTALRVAFTITILSTN